MNTHPGGDGEPRADILIVDDNVNNLLALEAILGDFGPVNLIRADSGLAALRCLLERDFALVILDVQMPGMDGFEVAQMIRGRERTRHIPIIFLTAHSQSDKAVVRGYSLGAVDFLFKPIIPEILKAKVHAFVELHRKREEVKQQAVREAQQRAEAELLRAQIDKERRETERLKLLSDTANRLFVEPEPQQILSEICDRLASHLGVDVYLVYITEPAAEQRPRLVAHRGIEPENIPEIDKLADLDVLLARDSPLPAELEVRAHVAYTLVAQERLMGVLFFGSRERAGFAPDEHQVMRTMADQIAMAVDRHHLIEALKQRAAELLEADRRKDRFLAILGHELRNPLAPILNALQVLQIKNQGDAMVSKALAAMDRQVRHLVHLVDDLLDVSRINNGKINLRRQPVELGNVIEQAVQLSTPLIRDRGHELTVEVHVTPLMIVGDPTRLSQIIANLLNNAAKYTPPGGRIWLAADVEGGTAVVRVRDTGLGLESELIPRIFEPFVQLDQRPTEGTVSGGLGIGLALVKQLVTMHGGTVSATSEGPGQGSEFVVSLPLPSSPIQHVDSEREASHSTPIMARGDQQLRIVVVDDSPDIRETLRDLLEICGHQVVVAGDGETGVGLVLATRPDMALIDIGLPGLDGYAVARRVRAQLGEQSIKLIALTGYGQPEDRQRALEAGFDAHLVKPVDLEDLSRILTDGDIHGNQ